MEEISPVDTYYNELMASDNPSLVLTRFYEFSYHLPFKVSHAKTFGRLLHLYSRKEIFLSLLDVFSYTEVAPEDHLLQSISYQIKKKYINLPEPPKELNAEEAEKNINKLEKKPLKIKGNPFERE